MFSASSTKRLLLVRTGAAALVLSAATVLAVAPAQAIPLFPGGPDIPLPFLPPPAGAPAAPLLPAPAPVGPGPANFSVPSVSPSGGEVVGVAQPIIIKFKEKVSDHATAERAIDISTAPSVPGHFYWINDSQVRWLPNEFYPAHTQVTVNAGGAVSSFATGDSVITTADDTTHQITVTKNGEVVKTMPTSMGKPGHETPNGTYIVGEKFAEMYMDSSTYGVPVDAPGGYRTYVQWATRISYNGIFVHAAPWSVDSQGSEDVSHGCLNVSTANGKWFFDNSQKGDPVVVVNSGGGVLGGSDGLGDWNR